MNHQVHVQILTVPSTLSSAFLGLRAMAKLQQLEGGPNPATLENSSSWDALKRAYVSRPQRQNNKQTKRPGVG